MSPAPLQGSLAASGGIYGATATSVAVASHLHHLLVLLLGLLDHLEAEGEGLSAHSGLSEHAWGRDPCT